MDRRPFAAYSALSPSSSSPTVTFATRGMTGRPSTAAPSRSLRRAFASASLLELLDSRLIRPFAL
jgi:hypothetical protein